MAEQKTAPREFVASATLEEANERLAEYSREKDRQTVEIRAKRRRSWFKAKTVSR